MRIGYRGELLDEPEIRAGFVGCGSHAFRNVYPTFQFTPVRLVATCDLQRAKAEEFARAFGAAAAYDDLDAMLERDDLDAVFIVTGYDERGRPQYPRLATRALEAGKHVWFEKPPAAEVDELEQLQKAAETAGRNVVVGMKKMFFPANEKAKALMDAPSFGEPTVATFRYPQHIPTTDEFAEYLHESKPVRSVIGFLDHMVHPASLMVFLLGMPRTLSYARSHNGAGLATFTFDSGAVASIVMSAGQGVGAGMEHTTILSTTGQWIEVENNIRVRLHRSPKLAYGASPDFYLGDTDGATTVWEPDWTLGQLYSKGIYLLGYCGEVEEFARSILENRPPAKGTLAQAKQVTRIFQGFAEGPGKTIELA